MSDKCSTIVCCFLCNGQVCCRVTCKDRKSQLFWATNVKVKSALKHALTAHTATVWYPCFHSTECYPQAFYQVSLIVCQDPLLLLGGEGLCELSVFPKTTINDLLRTQTWTFWPPPPPSSPPQSSLLILASPTFQVMVSNDWTQYWQWIPPLNENFWRTKILVENTRWLQHLR